MGAPGGGEAFLVDRLTTRGFSSLSSNTPHSGHPVTYRPDPSDQDEKRSLCEIMRRGICGRRIQDSLNNGKPHHRCTFSR
jgi:hypothetical protein